MDGGIARTKLAPKAPTRTRSAVTKYKHSWIANFIYKMHQPPPQSLPYDFLFKVLIIGDASVGKVRCN
jgi:hypothetical protein